MPVVRKDGLSGGRAGGRSVYGHVITEFSRMSRLLHFLTDGVPLARFAREGSTTSRYKTIESSQAYLPKLEKNLS